MSVDVTNVNADIDASGTSRQANMSRRPAVSIAPIAAAVVGNTANEHHHFVRSRAGHPGRHAEHHADRQQAGAQQHDDPARRRTLDGAGGRSGRLVPERGHGGDDQEGRHDRCADPQSADARRRWSPFVNTLTSTVNGISQNGPSAVLVTTGTKGTLIQTRFPIFHRWRFRLRHRVLLGSCPRSCAVVVIGPFCPPREVYLDDFETSAMAHRR